MSRGRSARSEEVRLEAPVPILARRGWMAADFRRFGRGRVTLRDPQAPTWPAGGERTQDYEVAVGWAVNAYIPLFRDEDRRRQLRLGPRSRSLADAAVAWIESRRKTSAQNTWQNDQTSLNHLRAYLGDSYRTDRLTVPVLQGFFDDLVERGYAVSSLHTMRRAVSGFLRSIGQEGRNAALAAQLPAQVHEEVATWTDEELARLRAAADDLDQRRRSFRRHRLLVELGIACGARRNELFALRWERIHVERRTVRITHQIAKGVHALTPLKGKLARTALLLPSWWDHHEEGESGYILAARHGSIPPPPDYFYDIRKVLLDAAGLYRPGLGYHIDRHTYARLFVEMGGRFEELQKSLGHKSVVTTERLYGHFHEDVAAELARRRIYREEPLRIVR